MSPDFSRHHKISASLPVNPSATLERALRLFEEERREPGFAVDLGCGAGADSVALLRAGWTVLAIDKEAEALATLRERAGDNDKLECLLSRMETCVLPAATIVNASFALPFCRPDAFLRLWSGICGALEPGGRFCGHLFGPEDGWAANPGVNAHTEQEARQLLQPFAIEHFEETRKEGRTLGGQPKQWHVFHIVGRKRGADQPAVA